MIKKHNWALNTDNVGVNGENNGNGNENGEKNNTRGTRRSSFNAHPLNACAHA